MSATGQIQTYGAVERSSRGAPIVFAAAFPANPFAGLQCWRYDLAQLYYWDGATWQLLINANLATTAINLAVATHEADTTAVHGIADTTDLVLASNIEDMLIVPGFTTTGTSTTKTLTSGTSFFRYLGRARRAYTSIDVRYRATQAAVTITWAELAIYSGDLVVGGSPSSERRGVTDISAIINSTGKKTTAVAVTGVTPGMGLWAVIGNSATTPAILRAGLSDNIDVGYQQSGVFQPSVTASVTPTIEGDTAASPWMAWKGS